ncbi:MAG TPA: nucleotidyl transferase AbiEii/AbiGii toxin family protein [Candidatus Baltobacteraceae bacterium]|nr:nucleotidyl transferase AbiEii/AbiGii toxin family protein [Candidatus Baltobacteraceae bacterium]
MASAQEPKKPRDTDPFAAAFLERLQDRPEAAEFVLGGYFALKHYLDYRETGDVDAWWRSREDPAALAAARDAFIATANAFGYTFRERSWGETVSLEAVDGNRRVFSFQVAVRSIELAQPIPSPWGRFPIETLEDNVASKMVALVARGAPRDFVDVKHVVDAGLMTPERCWALWAAKEPGEVSPATIDEARLRVKMHLAAIEARMPLARIPADRKRAAAELRSWYRDTFTAAPDPHHGDRRPDGETGHL